MDRTARFTSRTDRADGCRDPIPDSLADSLWLGGEAMVAPAWVLDAQIVDRPAHAVEADPTWLAI
ncbi:MAG: hypothetical protein ABI843_05470 [Dokdonella sp.]